MYRMLEPTNPSRGARLFRIVHWFVVLFGVSVMVTTTQPQLAAAKAGLLGAIIALVVAFFAAEYLLQLIVTVEEPWVDPLHPWVARLRWALSPEGLVDLIAVVPIPVALLFGVEPALAYLFGIFWLLKLARYSTSLAIVGRAIRNARSALLSVLLVFVVVLLFTSTLAYLLERTQQPEEFGSIPKALWWTITTLTTTGYGDAIPGTPAGRILAGVVMICGIAVFALWAGILATSFAQEMRRREFLRTWDLVAKVPFFQHVGAATIAEVAQLLQPCDAHAGATIMRRGEEGDCMFFIVDGEVEIELSPQPLRLEAGQFFGEIALITGDRRNATAKARDAVTMLRLDITDFRRLAASRPELTEAIDREANRRIESAVSTLGQDE